MRHRTITLRGEIDDGVLSLLVDEFRDALSDKDTMLIRFFVDSPGGIYSEKLNALADDIFAARSSKFIVSLVAGKCLSGAFWLAAATGEIWALSQSSEIGAIGVFRPIDLSDVPARKRPFTPEERARIESLTRFVMQTVIENTSPTENEIFIKAVSRYRGIPLDRVLEVAYGKRVFKAEEALSAGLIDEILT